MTSSTLQREPFAVEERDGRHVVLAYEDGAEREISSHPDQDTAKAVMRRLIAARHREGMVAGLRALANFLESTPELPATFASVNAYLQWEPGERERFIEAAGLIGEHKRTDSGDQIQLEKVFYDAGSHASVKYRVAAKRENVCVPRVEGGKVVWDLPAEITHSESRA